MHEENALNNSRVDTQDARASNRVDASAVVPLSVKVSGCIPRPIAQSVHFFRGKSALKMTLPCRQKGFVGINHSTSCSDGASGCWPVHSITAIYSRSDRKQVMLAGNACRTRQGEQTHHITLGKTSTLSGTDYRAVGQPTRERKYCL